MVLNGTGEVDQARLDVAAEALTALEK
jgi:hypothetical protein